MTRPRTRRRHGTRINRFKVKWDPRITGVRFKLYRRARAAWFGLSVNIEAGLMRITDQELRNRSVPSEEWLFYEGMVARAAHRCILYGGASLAASLEELVLEFVHRGLDAETVDELVGLGWYAIHISRGWTRTDHAKVDIHCVDCCTPADGYAGCGSADYSHACVDCGE